MLTPANDNPPHPSPVRSVALVIGTLTGWRRRLASLLLGAMATLALPPFYLLPLLPLSLCGLYWLVMASHRLRQSVADGWWFGAGYFAAGLYWIGNALLVDAERFGWLIPFAAIGLSGGLGLFMALMTMLFHRFRRLGGFLGIWLFALCWLALELLRGVIFTGFPWNLMGYVWSFSTLTVQLYAFLGVYVTGFFTVLLALLPAALIAANERPLATRIACLLAAGFALALLFAGHGRLEHAHDDHVEGVKLRLVQPAIPQTLKWDPEYQMEGLQKLASLSVSTGKEEITHIIWPESAMPFPFRSGDIWAERLAELVPPNGALLTGVTRISGSNEDATLEIFNSIQAVTAQGKVVMAYDKAKLVPFGEFVPLRDVLPIEKITPGTMDFSRGKQGQSFAPAGLPAFRPLVCYESIFPELSARAYPSWLLNVTNDAWFGDSTGPRQHAEMARARAVEQGVPLVRVANTGISMVVDGYGRVRQELDLGLTGVIDAPLPKPATYPTYYALWGTYYYGILALLTLIMIIGVRHGKVRLHKA